MKITAVSLLKRSLLLKCSTLIAMDQSSVIYCWTSCPVISPCCTAESQRLEAPSEDTVAETVSTHPAAENGAWTPSVDKRRNRSWSWNPYGSLPSPWPKNAATSTYYYKTPLKRGRRITTFYLEFFFHVSNVCFSCQDTAFGWSSRAQQLETVQAKCPQVCEEAEGRWRWLAGLSGALEEWHPPDWGWGRRTPSTASAASVLWMMKCLPDSSPAFTGMFGTGIQSYFYFLRFLVMLNLIIFLLMFSFVMLPIIVAPHASGNISYDLNDGEESRHLLVVYISAYQHPTAHEIMWFCSFILKSRISSQVWTFHCRKCVQRVSHQRTSWFGHLPWAHYRSALWWGKSVFYLIRWSENKCCFLAHGLFTLCRASWSRPTFSTATTEPTKSAFQTPLTTWRWRICWLL